MTIRIFLVDEDEAVRADLESFVNREEGMAVVGHAATVGDALMLVPGTQPKVVLTEAILPDGSGTELSRALLARYPGLRVLLLTALAADGAFIHASMGGASGYLLKPIRKGEVVDAIRRVAAGEELLDTALMGRILGQLLERPLEADRPRLSDEEKRLLVLIADGLTDPEIAQHVGLQQETVKLQVSEVLTKLGIRSGTGASTAPRE
jgi:two-component system response regulator DevR